MLLVHRFTQVQVCTVGHVSCKPQYRPAGACHCAQSLGAALSSCKCTALHCTCTRVHSVGITGSPARKMPQRMFLARAIAVATGQAMHHRCHLPDWHPPLVRRTLLHQAVILAFPGFVLGSLYSPCRTSDCLHGYSEYLHPSGQQTLSLDVNLYPPGSTEYVCSCQWHLGNSTR